MRIPALLIFFAAVPARATTVRALTEADMARRAEVVALATVSAVTPRWHASGVIVTDVELRTSRAIKGVATGAVVVFTQLGGSLDGRTLHVPGTSHYEVGEEVLVFLERGGAGLVEMGVGAGKYAVSRRDGEVVVQRELTGVAFAPVESSDPAAPFAVRPELLTSFLSRLAAVADGFASVRQFFSFG